MLRGIAPIISPELLDVLFKRGHGDEIVIADAFFPWDTFEEKVVRADGHKSAFAVIMTGETVKHENIILKKGVINR